MVSPEPGRSVASIRNIENALVTGRSFHPSTPPLDSAFSVRSHKAFSAAGPIYARSRYGSGTQQMQTTEVYLKADPTEKLETIESMTHPHLRRGHFRPVDKFLASLSLRGPKNMQS
jgi:hypothetical protein